MSDNLSTIDEILDAYDEGMDHDEFKAHLEKLMAAARLDERKQTQATFVSEHYISDAISVSNDRIAKLEQATKGEE